MKSKNKAILAFSAVFILAFISGFLVSRSLGDWQQGDRNNHRSWDRNDRPSGEIRQRIESRISGFLDLEDSQRGPFFESLETYHSELSRTMRERREADQQLLRESYNAFRDEMSAILDTLQIQKMDSRFHPDSVRQYRMRSNSHDRMR
jgi:hypothetical protein